MLLKRGCDFVQFFCRAGDDEGDALESTSSPYSRFVGSAIEAEAIHCTRDVSISWVVEICGSRYRDVLRGQAEVPLNAPVIRTLSQKTEKIPQWDDPHTMGRIESPESSGAPGIRGNLMRIQHCVQENGDREDDRRD